VATVISRTPEGLRQEQVQPEMGETVACYSCSFCKGGARLRAFPVRTVSVLAGGKHSVEGGTKSTSWVSGEVPRQPLCRLTDT